MPFNVSDPVLFYNKTVFEQAGLDPAVSPVSLEQLRATSQQIVDSGAAGTGIAFDSGVDSGGGWFIEQWFARAGELYADNGNGRLAPATQVLYAGPTGVAIMTEVQSMINDGLAVTVGDNASGQDALLKLADPASPAAMTIATSAAIGTVMSVLDGGLIPGITSAQLGIGPMPGPSDVPVGDRRRRVAVRRGRQGRRPGRRRVGLHPVPDVGPVAVDVGGGDGVRADPQGRPRARPRQDDRTPPTRGSRSPTTSCCRGRTTWRRSGRCSARCSRCAP